MSYSLKVAGGIRLCSHLWKKLSGGNKTNLSLFIDMPGLEFSILSKAFQYGMVIPLPILSGSLVFLSSCFGKTSGVCFNFK